MPVWSCSPLNEVAAGDTRKSVRRLVKDMDLFDAIQGRKSIRRFKQTPVPDEDIRKILGLNVLRVMKQAEKVAAGLQKTRQPSTATIDQLDAK